MAISYSDKPDTPNASFDEGGVSFEIDEGGPVDPPEDIFSTPPPAARHPPPALWAHTHAGGVASVGNANDPVSPRTARKNGDTSLWNPTDPYYYSDNHTNIALNPKSPYVDDPNDVRSPNDMSPYSDNPSSLETWDLDSPGTDPYVHVSPRKKWSTGLLGFILGTIVMVVIMLAIGGGDKNGVRVGSPLEENVGNGSIDGLYEGDDHVVVVYPEGEGEEDEHHGDGMEEAEIEGHIFHANESEEGSEEGGVADGSEATPAQGAGAPGEAAVTVKAQDVPASEPAAAAQQVAPAPKVEAVAPAPKPAPAPAPASNPSKFPPAGDVDMSIPFCGHCEWKHTRFTCAERAQYMLQRWSPTLAAAKEELMKKGHCPESRMKRPAAAQAPAPAPKPAADTIPKLEDCRQRPKPGEFSLDNFCPHCPYKNTDYSCIKRLQFVVSHYAKTVKQAKTDILNKGHCNAVKTEEEKQKLKEQGLENYCGMCMFKTNTCDHYSQQVGLQMKLNLMRDGWCHLPPYCDGNPEDWSPSTENAGTGDADGAGADAGDQPAGSPPVEARGSDGGQ